MKILIPILLLLTLGQSCTPSSQKADYLLLRHDTINDKYGYVNQQGDTVIRFGKYSYCFTDTFRTFAIVQKFFPESAADYFAIDRNDKTMYRVYNYDNGPDYESEGLFRIIENRSVGKKIGYADATTGEIVIPPQYEGAFPFEKGMARVAIHCTEKKDDENIIWESDDWIYIDKKGNIVKGK